jgi:hypothetical protein
MIVVYDEKLEEVVTREWLEKRISQAIRMIEYGKNIFSDGTRDDVTYWGYSLPLLRRERDRLTAFREELDKLESLEG